MRKGLTAIEVVVAIVAVLLLVMVALPFLGKKTHCGSGGKEAVNLQNIQRAMETYASANKGYYPGLNSTGDYLMNGLKGTVFTALGNASTAVEEKSGDGCSIATGTNLALACLLEDACVAPSQLISPGETNLTVTEISSASAAGVAVSVQDCHCSHAMLAYGKKV